MDKLNTLRQHGLFDVKVPRYTSFPPANRFLPDVGRHSQREWLAALAPNEAVSIYVHIPFCRRLCWFCACRTQGTRTLKPVEDYLRHLIKEIKTIAEHVPKGLRMGRLHLGGGTPTLMRADQMRRLLDALHSAFPLSKDFEFSVEVDPTEAAIGVLDELANWNLGRASIGVQDFDPKVQKAIGRPQSLEQTEDVIAQLRQRGIRSLNIDLLYGLPFQTEQSLTSTLNKVVDLRPDRIALYGYAHVPHMSKRQVMIPDDQLPAAEARYSAAQRAGERLGASGYIPLGIDHFALPNDSLTMAAKSGRMHRNFQGYTDDPCSTLIGFGASAISRFPQGYLQNAVATAAYQNRINADGFAGHKGYALTQTDQLLADIIDRLMCDGRLDFDSLRQQYPSCTTQIAASQHTLIETYSDVLEHRSDELTLKPELKDLARIIAAGLDEGLKAEHQHSMAI